MQPSQRMRGWNPLSVASLDWDNVKPHHFFDGCIDRPEFVSRCNGVINLPKLLHDSLHVHAFVSIYENNCAKQGAVLLQYGNICGIGHDEMIPRQHEHAVKHGHGAPHVGVKAIHFVKIFVQHELPARGIGKMIQNFGVVLLYYRI